MNLNDFYDYKNQLMKDLLTDKEIVRLMQPEKGLNNAIDLAYTQIFPYEYIPETIQKGNTYICFDIDIQSQTAGKTFYYPYIYVWVFAHRSKLRLPEGGVRTDKICSRICEIMNGSRLYTLGELNLYSSKRFAPVTDYNGKVLTFIGREFSKQHNDNKILPNNRKA